MKFRRVLCVGVVAAGAALMGPFAAAPSVAGDNPAGPGPAQISALYKITLNGFELGEFRFTSRTATGSYFLDSNVELSALLGAFHWRGVTHTEGQLSNGALKPRDFSFDFRGNAGSGSIKMDFNGAGVQSVSAAPQTFLTADTVPIEHQHVKGVLDPLTAILALTRAGDGNPCGRKVGIFDGKQRFDLALSFRRNEQAADPQPVGATGPGIVCKVKYVPIAGYRPTTETLDMAANNGIEIAFRAVPRIGLLVPYRVSIPTIAGSAQLTLADISVATADSDRVAQAE